MVEAEQPHHETGRAETALRAMLLDHRLLDRMQLAVGNIFNGDHLGAVSLPREHDAGIDRPIDDAASVKTAQHDRAGTAVALGAAFLGAGRALLKPQIVEERHVRRKIGALDQTAAAIKSDLVAHVFTSRRGDLTPAAGCNFRSESSAWQMRQELGRCVKVA
jgi:hypothetical protein